MIKTILSAFLLFTPFAFGQYCMSGGPTSTIDSNLESLVLIGTAGSINYTGCPGVTGVEEFLGQTASLNAGNSYSISVHFGTCGGNYSGVGEAWIDYNGNGIFEQTESILTWQGTPPVGVLNFNFTVPGAALTGLTRMRVMQAEQLTLPLDPCASFSWGSVTDFSIQIMSGVDCSSYTGDDKQDARPVPGLPYSESHSTSVCYSSQNPTYGSPDVFYEVVTNGLNSLNVSLCGSSFDTYLTVQDKWGTVIATNDDAPGCSPQSELDVSVAGLDTVYVIVEGWGTQSGDYNIAIGEGSLDVNTLSNELFSIYPNPAKNELQIKGDFSGTLHIINGEGRIVLEQNITPQTHVNTSELSEGFYIVRLTNEYKSIDKKLIIKR